MPNDCFGWLWMMTVQVFYTNTSQYWQISSISNNKCGQTLPTKCTTLSMAALTSRTDYFSLVDLSKQPGMSVMRKHPKLNSCMSLLFERKMNASLKCNKDRVVFKFDDSFHLSSPNWTCATKRDNLRLPGSQPAMPKKDS